jgi:CheY-like chemotaxis protein/two-component sensor histidine kinase
MALGTALSLILAAGFWLLRSRQSAQRSERRQARFIGVMSHEVRNAAQALVTSVDLLSQSGLDRGQRQLVDAARAAGVGLRQLLGHALDYSRMAAGQFRPCLDWHDIDALARDCVTAIRPAVEAKGLRMTLQLAPDPLPRLRTDEVALRQILSNLLGNALKFTAQGSITVRLCLLRGPSGNQLQVVVSDTGVGIPVERQSSVFRPFAQAHDAHSRDMGGVGLGLSICRDLVHALQGRIDLQSEPGQGSRFEVTLPVSCLSTSVRVAGQPLAGHTLLLVEDHAPSRDLVARQLVALGAAASTCRDGASALRLQAAQPSAVVMIDCDLADMSGYQLAVALRGLERAHGRPAALLVAFSGTDSLAHVQRCRASGMDAVLGKPLDPSQLLAILGVAVDEAGTVAPAKMTAHDPSLAPLLRSLQDEVEALRQARADGELRLVRHHAHRAAGVLRMLGHESLAGTAADLHELSLASTLNWNEMDRLLDHLQQAVKTLAEACPT